MEADEELDSASCPGIIDGNPCGKNLARKTNFCPECGLEVDPLIFKRQKVVVDVPNVNICDGFDKDGNVCGHELSQKQRFCPNCGKPSSKSGSTVSSDSISSHQSIEAPSSLPVADAPDEQAKQECDTKSKDPESLKSIRLNYTQDNSVDSGLQISTSPEDGSPAQQELNSEDGTMRDSSADADKGKADSTAEPSACARQSDSGEAQGTAGKFKSEIRMQVETASTVDQKSCDELESSSLPQKKDKENAGPTDESSTSEVVDQRKASNVNHQSGVQINDDSFSEHLDGKDSSKPAEDAAENAREKEGAPNVEKSAFKNQSESQNVPVNRDRETSENPLAAESSVDVETQKQPSGNSNLPRKSDSHSTTDQSRITVYDRDGKEREVTVLPPKGQRGEDLDKSWDKLPKQQINTRSQTKAGQFQPKVVLRFHVVLPEKDFHFKPKTDVVIMRFHQQELGGWESNRLRMMQEKRIDDEHVLLTCAIEVDKQLLTAKRYLQYKYAILHADGKVKYEFVPKKTWVGGIANRRLDIADEILRSITEWHQYDGIMNVEPESSILKGFSSAYDKWTGRHYDQVMKKTKNAVFAMLPAWKDIMNGSTGYASGFLDNLDQVCYCAKTYFLNDKVETDESKIKEVLEEYIRPEMQQLTNRLMRVLDESDKEAGLRLASACCLMYIIQNYRLDCDSKTTRPLFYALALRVRDKTSLCLDYQQLTDVCFSTVVWQRKLAGTLLNFICQMCRRDFVEPLWLLAVPLLHLLDGYVKPFEQPKLGFNHQKPEWWGLQNFSRFVDDFKRSNKNTMPTKEYLDVLGPLFEIDKLLPRTVVAVMSVQHIADLFRSLLFPPEVCLANLYYFATKEKDPMVILPGAEVVEEILRSWVLEFDANNTEFIKSKVDEIKMHYKFAGQFLDVVCREYKYKYEAVNIIVTALQICVNSISNIQKLTAIEVAGNKPLDPKDFNVDDEMRILMRSVIGWLQSCSSTFLVTESYFSYYPLQIDEQEIQVCAALVNVKFFDVETGAKWKMQIDQHLAQRITKLSPRLRVMVFCHLDFTKYPSEIENCFSREAFKVLENAETVRSGDFSFVFDIADRGDYAQRIRGLLSHILEKSWPKRSDGKEVEGDIILRHILGWPSFKRFLNLFCKKDGRSKVIELLSDECRECITVAMSVFDAIVEQLLSGSLTVMQLNILLEEKNKEAFLEIFQIMEKNSESGMKNVPESGVKDINKSSVLLKVLTWRQAELKSIGDLCEKLENFTNICGRVDSSELDQLRKSLSQNRETLKMNALCKVRTYAPDVANAAYQPEITFFSLTPKSIPMLNELWNLKEGVIFKEFMWNRCAKRMTDKLQGDCKFDTIMSEVWEPAKKLWDSFCQEVESGELTFKKTDELFGMFDKNYDSIEKELRTACKQRDVVKERLGQIKQYHQLDQYSHGAHIIIELRDKFELIGDFSIPETLADMVKNKKKSLSQITDELVASGRQLEEITDDKVKSLEVFLNHKKFVDWLQNSIKNPREVKVLVDLAMINAEGQGDMEVQRVKCLHATATGYGPLIYDLKQEMGFREFLPLCQAVWRVLEIDKELPNKFRDTARHLDWLIRIKESHGSVELNALANAQAINAKGIYSVGNLGKGIKSLEDVIVLKLRLEKGERDVGQDSFVSEEVERSKWQTLNVQQLKDLQSKLMLVAGKAQEGKEKDVGNFVEILDGITRLGSLYIRICTAGCSLFHHWRAIFDCDPNKPVYVRIEFGRDAQEAVGSRHMLCGWKKHAENGVCGYILDMCAFMDACLKEWLDHIEAHRTEFHYLNYYTTEQLVILQNELAKINVDKTQISKDIYPLLSLIKKNCSLKDIGDATYGAFRSLEEKEKRAAQEEKAPMEVEKEDEVDETLEQQEVAKKFLEEVESAGYSRKLALRALKNCDPENFGDGIIWCMEHSDLDDGDQEEEEREEEEKMDDGSSVDNHQDRKIEFSGLNLYTTMEALTANLFKAPNLADKLERLSTRLDELWKNYQNEMNLSLADYISTKHLGCMLGHLAKLDDLTIGRTLPDYCKKGKPNLLLCSRADIFPVVISIYMNSKSQKNILPGIDEVLVCNAHTTAEDVELLWRRAEGDARNGFHGKIYCLVHAELLDYDIARRVEQSLDRHSHEAKDLQLVVVGCREQEDRSHMINALDRHRVKAPGVELQEVREYIKQHLTVTSTRSGRTAAELDPERCSVRVIKSHRAGVGKSLKVRRLLGQRQEWGLPRHGYDGSFLVSIPLHCKSVDPSVVLARLLRHSLRPEVIVPRIFHIDVAHEVQEGVDYLLFNLLILGSITDRGGYVWSRSPNDLYIIETMPLIQREAKASERRNQEFQYVHHIFQLLPTVTCWSPTDSLSILNGRANDVAERYTMAIVSGHDQKMDEKEFQSAMFQRPFQYLMRFDRNQELHGIQSNVPVGNTVECIQCLLNHCGIRDPSWSELRHFVNFLNVQLRSCEESVFCSDFLAPDLPGFVRFVVQFMMQMSKDFATRSLTISEETPEVASQLLSQENHGDDEFLGGYGLKRRWESSPHPYLFFNADRNSFTFMGFIVNPNTGDILEPGTNRILTPRVVQRVLYDALVRNRVNLGENFDALERAQKIEKMCHILGIEFVYDPDSTYELTADNVKKMLAIYMRFRCDIPVIVMGETGCGKTTLIKFMCDLWKPPGVELKNMVLMKVHGGTTAADIERKVREAADLAKSNREEFPNVQTVLFFDEANTTDAIGMIKEIMCDHTIGGEPLPSTHGLKLIAACNPYRKHSDEMIQRLEHAGLGYHIKAHQTADKLGRIPMRHLVYRVQSLPQSMLPLVWDFGQLSTEVETLYIRQMVHRYVVDDPTLNRIPNLEETVSKILAMSQEFMRQQKDECSFVSLRDVDRALRVMMWFYPRGELFEKMNEKAAQEMQEPFVGGVLAGDNGGNEEDDDEEDQPGPPMYQPPHALTRALVLALGVCYHACLQKRKEYRDFIARYFVGPCALERGASAIEKNINWCQEVFLDEVELGDNIARNQALKENLFMMVICIELRIPLFLVGKPGSSKSLAKTIVADAMQGEAARSELFRTLKSVHMVSYQCSPLSTPDGIVGTFRQCAKLQEGQDLDKFVSVVVLDEVGLAEDSDRMPLKTLHPLLEDGCEGDEIPAPHKKVGFIGISNWALDPAKMNRGILVQRGVPDEQELEQSAKGICAKDKVIARRIDVLVQPMARAYLEMYNSALDIREFFGLRDFYSLIKMVHGFMKRSGLFPSWAELKHAILRNFGGLDNIHPLEVFERYLQNINKNQPVRDTDPPCDSASLIRCSLSGKDGDSESRYLLILTENYAALSLLEHELLKIKDAIIIFGSSFPKDQEYTQVCRNINRIKVCMETGRTIVLLNLENLYESLYDALNQYYVWFGDERFVDLGLGTQRVKCRVHPAFRLIVVAEKQVVYEKFPIPLINRLEKHFLAMSTMLKEDEMEIAERLKHWAVDFSTVDNYPARSASQPKPGDVFIGYHADTAASLVLQVCHSREMTTADEILEAAQELLLCCAVPEAILRLRNGRLAASADKIYKMYFEDQCHGCITDFLQRIVVSAEPERSQFVQVTTHSRLLLPRDANLIAEVLGMKKGDIVLEALNAFGTEQQFCRRLKEFFTKSTDGNRVLLLQCDSGDIHADLIACARYNICNEFLQMEAGDNSGGRNLSHVIFIVQLPRIAGGCFVGFQGGKWMSYHIDDLHPPEDKIPPLANLKGRSLGALFEAATVVKNRAEEPMEEEDANEEELQAGEEEEKDQMEEEEEKGEGEPMDTDVRNEESANEGTETIVRLQKKLARDGARFTREKLELDVDGIIKRCLHGAMAMLKDATRGEAVKMRKTHRLQLLLRHLEHGAEEGKLNLMTVIRKRLTLLLKDKEEMAMDAEKASHWLSNDAASFEAICKAGTFRRALWQYLETGVTPLLAGIVAFADTNANLDILDDNSDEWISSMWLEMLDNTDITMLRFKDLQTVTQRMEVKEFEVKMTGAYGSFFQNQLPFSWVIKEQTDRLIYVANQDVRRDSRTMAENALRASALGKVLEKAEAEGGKQNVVGRYLADLVRMVHRCHSKNPDAEYKLVIKDIEYALRYSHLQEQAGERSDEEGEVAEATFLDPSAYLESSFPRIHLAYESIRKRLTIFSELVQLWPESVERLAAVDRTMPLDLKCLLLMMEDWGARTSAELKGVDTRKTWTNNVRRMTPVVLRLLESVTDVMPEHVQYRDKCRFAWNRIGAVQLFVEHVCPSDDADFKQSNKWCLSLWAALGDKTDFKTVKSFDNLEKFFRTCNKMASEAFFGKLQNCPVCNEVVEFPVKLPCDHKLCRKCLVELKETSYYRCPDTNCGKPFNQNLKAEPVSLQKNGEKKFSRYKQQCNAFFMEVVSRFCFTDNTPPAEEVIRKLMGYVTHRSRWRETHSGAGDAGGSAVKTKKMFEESLDPTPVVRSFLLQLLLRANIESVRKYLEEYFENALGLVNSDPAQTIELCILCVQCLEDHHHSQSAQYHDEIQRIHFARHLLNDSMNLLRRDQLAVAMETLEEVARVRFGLNDTALWMHRLYIKKDVGKTLNIEVIRLIEAARAICDQDLLKWPRIYLMRQLARRYGMDSLKQLSELQQWIIPNHARRNDNDAIPDRYIICGDDYQRLRELLAEVMIGKDLGPLEDALKKLECSAEVAEYVALLATYREVTSANVHEDIQRRPTPEIVNKLTEFYNTCPTFKNKALSQAIVGNSLDGCLRVMTCRDALDRDVAEIIVQFKILLTNSQNNGLQRPWIDMSTAPQNMQNSFLPTMPQDDLDEIRAVVEKTRTAGENVTFYKCPNGHPYVIGNCGLPGMVYTCAQCGAGVGGTNHNLLPGNTAMGAIVDNTRRGHILGQPQKRLPVPERQLSAAATAIMRALLHMSMYLGSLENPQAVGQLIVPPVDSANVSRFLFDHILSDVDTIQNAVGRSRDDVFLFLHILLDFMIRNVQHVDGLDLQLQTKESRSNWESSYVNAYIAQALQGLDAKIQGANNKMVNDNRLGNNPLLRTIFEVDSPAENSNVRKIQEEPSLWRFRSLICLEHLAHAFDENLTQKKGKGRDGKELKTFPILRLFLKHEHQLRAVRLLPNILRLHRLLLQRLNRYVHSSEATTMKIREFLDNITDENQCQELHILINDFSEAWDCIRSSLPNHPFGGLPGYTIPLEFTQEPLTLESCLAMLLPSLSGWGLCSVGLVYYLHALQNDFLESYSKEMKQTLQARVDIYDASYAHLVAYHPVHDLQPIILANCNYSLEVGKGTTIEYDFGSMEKQLMERFVRGRPRLGIGSQMAFINYREDFTNASVFDQLRNRIPQEPLPSPGDLERELRHKPTEVTDLLASIDIAVLYLVSVGGDPDTKLAKFMFDTLRMKHTQAMLLSYRLKHVESLWVMLSYLRARMQARYGHEPFEKVDEKYREQLPDDLLKKLRLGFQHIQMDAFSILLYKFIIFRITVKQNAADEDYTDNSNYPLKEMLVYYMSESSSEYNIPALEDDRFPADIKFKHCVATWLCALAFRHQP